MRCFYREERKVRKLPGLAHFAFFAVSQQQLPSNGFKIGDNSITQLKCLKLSKQSLHLKLQKPNPVIPLFSIKNNQ